MTEPENNLVGEGFYSIQEQNRFAKLISIVTLYQQDTDAVKANCEKEAKRLKFPYGWQSTGSYEGLKRWFFQNCR